MNNDSIIETGAIKGNEVWPAPLRALAHTVSVIFHPLFIPSYIVLYLVYAEPYAFAGISDKLKLFRVISVVFNTAFLPLFSVALMKQLGFVKSIFLRTQQDRIIPYIVCMIYYFFAWWVSRNLHESPMLTTMLLSVFLCSIAGMMANIYYKISMHGIAVGALFILFMWMAFNDTAANGSYLPVVILITGLVCTARFIVSDHNGFEVYSGLLAGAVCQLVAIAIVT